MRLFSTSTILALACASCDLVGGGVDEGYYLRFEPLEGSPSAGGARSVMLGDTLLGTSGTDTSVLSGSGESRWPLAWVTVVNGAAYGIDRTRGGVWKTTDGQTFEQVSTEVFDTLSSFDETLVALQRRSMGRYALFTSEDLGATWSTSTDLTAGFEFGNGESSWLTKGAAGRVRATIEVFAFDVADNANYASQTYDISASGAVVVGRTGNPEIASAPPPFPELVTPTGLAFFQNRDPLISKLRVGDMTSLTVLQDPGASPDLSSGVQLRWALPERDENTLGTELFALGTDTSGRLLVSSAIGLYRSINPLSDEGDRADILRGPGCAGRSSWAAEWSDDTTDVTVTNDSGRRLHMWNIDTGMGWNSMGLLEAGAETTTWIMRGRRLMFTAPEDDTCVAVLALPDEQTAAVTVNPL